MSSENFENAVRGWVARTQELKDLEASIKKVKRAQQEASNDLAMLIVPEDIAIGEKISVWVRIDRHTERMLQVIAKRYTNMGMKKEFEVSYRGDPRTAPE